eukprot:363267-Chlamydomonas_euryale.AAC.8
MQQGPTRGPPPPSSWQHHTGDFQHTRAPIPHAIAEAGAVAAELRNHALALQFRVTLGLPLPLPRVFTHAQQAKPLLALGHQGHGAVVIADEPTHTPPRPCGAAGLRAAPAASRGFEAAAARMPTLAREKTPFGFRFRALPPTLGSWAGARALTRRAHAARRGGEAAPAQRVRVGGDGRNQQALPSPPPPTPKPSPAVALPATASDRRRPSLPALLLLVCATPPRPPSQCAASNIATPSIPSCTAMESRRLAEATSVGGAGVCDEHCRRSGGVKDSF